MPYTKLIRAGVSTVGKFPSSHPRGDPAMGVGKMEVAQDSPDTHPALLLDLWPRAGHFPSILGALPALIAEVYQRP